jgi:hypothetical protein
MSDVGDAFLSLISASVVFGELSVKGKARRADTVSTTDD